MTFFLPTLAGGGGGFFYYWPFYWLGLPLPPCPYYPLLKGFKPPPGGWLPINLNYYPQYCFMDYYIENYIDGRWSHNYIDNCIISNWINYIYSVIDRLHTQYQDRYDSIELQIRNITLNH